MKLDIPVWETGDPIAIVIGIAAFIALFQFKVDMLKVLGASMAAGVIGFYLF